MGHLLRDRPLSPVPFTVGSMANQASSCFPSRQALQQRSSARASSWPQQLTLEPFPARPDRRAVDCQSRDCEAASRDVSRADSRSRQIEVRRSKRRRAHGFRLPRGRPHHRVVASADDTSRGKALDRRNGGSPGGPRPPRPPERQEVVGTRSAVVHQVSQWRRHCQPASNGSTTRSHAGARARSTTKVFACPPDSRGCLSGWSTTSCSTSSRT